MKAAIIALALFCASSAVAQPIKVASVGDSITLGVGIHSPETNSYPAQLQKMLGEKFEVKNFRAKDATLIPDPPAASSKSPEFQQTKKKPSPRRQDEITHKISSGSDIAAPHNGGCNFAFLHGHVEFI